MNRGLSRDLVDRFGSPLYAYDAGRFRSQIAAMRDAFGERVRIAFALKANPLVALAVIARDAGLGVEVASAGETLVAREAGFRGEDVLFAGPGKSDEDLRAALASGARIHIESEGEHERLVAMTADSGARPDVAIRVQPGRAVRGAGLRMADASSRFGVDRARVAELAERVVRVGACRLVGLHSHTGSQVFDADAWLDAAAGLVELAGDVETAIGRPLSSLDFGGGFGWPVHDGDPEFDLGRAGRGLRELLDLAGGAGREAWIEPGRWLVASAGVYLTRVVDVKSSGGRRHVVLDGGMHHFGAAAGFGAPMRRAWSIVHTDDPDAKGELEPVTIGGPLCTPADRFGVGLRLPHVSVGDVIAIRDAGAYGLTYSPSAFLQRPTPAEVLVDGEDVRVVRAAGRPDDALRGQSW